ncbi:membrane-associated kinase regulator 1 [Pyrus ussuriensis x Pyrus communis]|uniref:Membrane-associated kinase regulator 1 n=1 Tax=Pyrus ussuriensis x Pyrus communis TaxID=2448454 RepID=A0A5N5FMU3_9ROSA|nr:membrane-associated kinase regulator 1 [Pyrus ussuriensis x Pyrus communis]
METSRTRKDPTNNVTKPNPHPPRRHLHQKSQTLPPSPTHSFHSSSSSSDFEFTISLSPRKSSNALCPADELFYKGQILPLHLSPRLSMVRNLRLPSSASYSSFSDTTTSRDSTGSSSNESRDSTSSFASDLVLLADQSCDSSRRPSSVAEENNEDSLFKRAFNYNNNKYVSVHSNDSVSKKKYFSLSRFSSVFKKEPKVQKNNTTDPYNKAANPATAGLGSNNAVKPKRLSTTAKEVISKYLKKVKPLYEKLSQKQQQQQQQKMGGGGGGLGIMTTTSISTPKTSDKCTAATARNNNTDCGSNNHVLVSHSFSGNLRYPRRRECISSCPSSMRGSPSHSGVLSRTLGPTGSGGGGASSSTSSYGDRSSMEELQSAIQGAIAHCKNSLVHGKSTTTMVGHEI